MNYLDAFRPERVTAPQGGFDPTRGSGPAPPGGLEIPLMREIVAGQWGALEGPHKILERGHWPMITKPEDRARELVALAKA